MWWDFATYAEGRSWLRRGLEASGDAPPLDRSTELLPTVLDPTLDDRLAIAHAAYVKGNELVALGRHAEAEPCFVEAVARFDALGSDVDVAISTLRLATFAYGRGELGRARRYLDGMTTLSLTDETRCLRSDYHFLLALVACETSELGAAAAAMAEVIAIEEEFDYPYSEELLAGTAVFASALGEHEVAARLLGTVERECEKLGTLNSYPDRSADKRAEASARAALGGAGIAEAWEQGRRLPLFEAIDVARAFLAGAMARHGESRTAETTSRSLGPHGLTRRELDVLREVAAGKSNREISEALYISIPTVKRHLTNILGKLGLPSRSALNTYAHAHGLGPGQAERLVQPMIGGSWSGAEDAGHNYDFCTMRAHHLRSSMERRDRRGDAPAREEDGRERRHRGDGQVQPEDGGPGVRRCGAGGGGGAGRALACDCPVHVGGRAD